MENQKTDVVLIGAGIMSATLGALLKQLQPDWKMDVYERLDAAAAESSDAWNNAGTGHSAFCELNYTPEKEDGSIDTKKALGIAEAFEVSKQFWAHLVEQRIITPPAAFIKSIPHCSFVWSEKNVQYLRKRYDALQQSPLFYGMQYSEDAAEIKNWMPLVMEGREGEVVAATRMDLGTDVNFGALTRCLFDHLQNSGTGLHFNEEVRDIERSGDDTSWLIRLKK